MPVRLTYKGEKEFRTVLGGLLSIMLMLAGLGYTVSYLYNGFVNTEFNISTSTRIQNFYNNYEPVFLDTSLNTLAMAIDVS